jgi:hypothetical protein
MCKMQVQQAQEVQVKEQTIWRCRCRYGRGTEVHIWYRGGAEVQVQRCRFAGADNRVRVQRCRGAQVQVQIWTRC